jgi:hypothetical protein
LGFGYLGACGVRAGGFVKESMIKDEHIGQCSFCEVVPAAHRVRVAGEFLGNACCWCMDIVMVAASRIVPVDEGAEGLARFRAEHLAECGFPHT